MIRGLLILGWGAACALGIPAAPAAAEDVQLRFRGVTLNANLELAEGTSAADGIVLITHGLMANHRMELVSTLQALLKERGRSSLAITLSLGRDDRRGTVDCALAHRHRRSDALDEIGAWIAWLKTQGAVPLALLGHSSGGNQAAWYAATRADPAIRAVVLLAPSTWDPGGAAERYRARHGKALADVLARARGMVGSGQGSAVMENTGFLYCPGASRVTADSFLSYYGGAPDRYTPALLPRIAKPTLVIAGTEDRVVPDVIDAVRPMADGRKLRLVAVDGAGHFFRDLFAEDVADAIDDFLPF